MALRQPVPLYQHRGLVLVTAPTEEPVTAAELYTQLNATAADVPDADTLITDAREYIENKAGIAFLTQTWKLALDRWPAGGEAWWDGVREGSISSLYGANTQRSIAVPRWPLASITSVKTFDEASNETTITVANTFDLDTYGRPGRLSLKRSAVWPVALRGTNAIEIVFVAGFTSASNVPGPLKRAVKQLAAFYYSHRGDDCSPDDAYEKSGAAAILNDYRPARI